MDESKLKDKEISLGDIFEIFISKKKLIITLGVVGYLGGVTVSNFLEPIYTSEVTMISQLGTQSSTPSGLSGLASMAGINLGDSPGDRESASALATLNSRTFLSAYINNNKLKPKLFPDLWDQNKNKWKNDVPSDLGSVSSLKKMITLKKQESGILIYQINSYSAELSSELANSLIESINNFVRQQTVEEAQKSILFLKKELSSTNLAGIQNTIYRQIEAQTKRMTLANARDQYAYKVIDRAVTSLSPSWPNKLQVSLLGLVIGIILGAMISLYSGLIGKEID
tara:strand:+ start:1341 stop:2189 length:849 start_codon:yes stop_codon:yes gene_type:complete